MATWPNISTPTFGTEWEIYKPQIVTEFESNAYQSRPGATKAVYFMPMRWEYMTHADLLLLQAFFDANVGNSFDLPNPLTGATDTACFVENSIKARVIAKVEGAFIYSVDCLIRKV